MDLRVNAKNSVSPAFQKLYRPDYNTVKKAMGKETFTKYIFDICDGIEKRGIAEDVDIKFVDWALAPNPNISLRYATYRISKVNGKEYMQGIINPSVKLKFAKTPEDALKNGIGNIIETKEDFLKINNMP